MARKFSFDDRGTAVFFFEPHESSKGLTVAKLDRSAGTWNGKIDVSRWAASKGFRGEIARATHI